MSQEYTAKDRILRVLKAIAEYPFHYTKKDLAQKYGCTPRTISNDFETIENVGYELSIDDNYRYELKANKSYKQLKDLLHFTEADQVLLHQAIDQIAPYTQSGQQLKKKLASLYDFRKLGYSYLRKPYLKKVDKLEQAEKQEKVIILKDYRSSNSNNIEDRKVECFHYSPPDDTLQAYDLDRNDLRHFRISRILRIEVTDQHWQHKKRHIVLPTDVFRIVDPKQVQVHLRIKVGAYNELIERFPQTKAAILQDEEEEDVYDFQCKVNHRFFGLTNFILGFHHQMVEIIEPESLKEHLRKQIAEMQDLF
ncbi:MAG: WYL domain-containing protein [Bacteroidota bacterium]